MTGIASEILNSKEFSEAVAREFQRMEREAKELADLDLSEFIEEEDGVLTIRFISKMKAAELLSFKDTKSIERLAKQITPFAVTHRKRVYYMAKQVLQSGKHKRFNKIN